MHSTHIKKMIIFENYFHGNGFFVTVMFHQSNVVSVNCFACQMSLVAFVICLRNYEI